MFSTRSTATWIAWKPPRSPRRRHPTLWIRPRDQPGPEADAADEIKLTDPMRAGTIRRLFPMKSFQVPFADRRIVLPLAAALVALAPTAPSAAPPAAAPAPGSEVVRLGGTTLGRDELRKLATFHEAREQDVVLYWLRDRALVDLVTARKLSPPEGFVERELAERRRELEAGRPATREFEKAVAAGLIAWNEAAKAGKPPAARADAAWAAAGGDKNNGGFEREGLVEAVGDFAADAEAAARFLAFQTSSVDDQLSASRPVIEWAGRLLATETALAGDVKPTPAEIDAVRAGLPAELKQLAAKDPALAARMAEDGKRRRAVDKVLFAEIRKSAKFADPQLRRLVEAEMDGAATAWNGKRGADVVPFRSPKAQ